MNIHDLCSRQVANRTREAKLMLHKYRCFFAVSLVTSYQAGQLCWSLTNLNQSHVNDCHRCTPEFRLAPLLTFKLDGQHPGKLVGSRGLIPSLRSGSNQS
jgi:hypothetical protein